MIAVIPARGGSKGLPGKNIKELNGKPLIAYSIEAALKAKSIERVITSTDSMEIAEVAVKYGAEVPYLRPVELSSDTARAIDAYLHLINWLQNEQGVTTKDICVLLPTSPLRIAEDIDNAIDLYNSKKADSVVSYVKEHHPISWHKYINQDGTFTNIFEDDINNRQDEKVSYFPNGSIYIFSTKLLDCGKYYSENSYAYIMPRERSIDIDFIEDFEYAEYILNKRKA